MDRDTLLIFGLVLLTVILAVFIAPKPITIEPNDSTLQGEIEIGVIAPTTDARACLLMALWVLVPVGLLGML
jgi:hypothetical protein